MTLLETNPEGILIRCDASGEIGFGHLVRCLALADELSRKEKVRIGFVVREGTMGSEVVRQRDYPISYLPPKNDDYGVFLIETMRQFHATTLVVDVRDDLSRDHLDQLRSEGFLVVLLDDLSDRRFAADLAFYPPVPQVRKADWAAFHGEHFIGWEWTILRPQFAAPLLPSGVGNSLLITMGGSDPDGMTLKAIQAVELSNADVSTVVVLGAGFRHRSELMRLLSRTTRKFRIQENVSDMRGLMIQAKIAICAYGMTAFELAACGVPTLYLCLTEDHAESASALELVGVGCSLGLSRDVTNRKLADALTDLLADSARRSRMSVAARALIDGRGAQRTAEILLDRIRFRQVV
jgi:spore coat polysaccharide biosynthesis predicted glycosyltransferase SpsG